LPMNRKGLRKSLSKLWDNQFKGTQTNRKCKYRERLNSYNRISIYRAYQSIFVY